MSDDAAARGGDGDLVRTLLVTIGTRGDVQPMRTLGLRLPARGHEVAERLRGEDGAAEAIARIEELAA